jgi:protein-tyrosine phosphatase
LIDLHCHLLDGVGGGPESFEEAVEVCRRAAADGVRMIVATPRWAAQSEKPPLAFPEYWQKLERLQQAMGEAVTLKSGFLIGFRPDLPVLLERYGSSISLGGGRYVFISLSALQVPAETEEVWGKILEQRFSVLLARAECNGALRRDPSRLERWIESGILLQLDAASITGLHGHEIQNFAFQCVKRYEGSVVIAASVGGTRARHSTLAQAREQLLKKSQSRRVRRLLTEIPALMLTADQCRTGEDADRSWRLRLRSRLRPLRSHRPLPDES